MSPLLQSIGSISVHEFSNIFNGCMIPPLQGCFSPLLSSHQFKHPMHYKSIYNFVPTDLYTHYQLKNKNYHYMDLCFSHDLQTLESIHDCMGQVTGYFDHHHRYFYVISNCQKGLLGRSLLKLFHQYPYLCIKKKYPLFLYEKWSDYPYTLFEYRRHSISSLTLEK